MHELHRTQLSVFPAQDVTDLRVLSRTYMEMLRDLSPPLNASSRWSATRERIRNDPRFKVLLQATSFWYCEAIEDPREAIEDPRDTQSLA